MLRKSAIIVGFDHPFIEALAGAGIRVACQIGTGPNGSGGDFEYVAHEDFVRYKLAPPRHVPPGDELHSRIHALCFAEFERCVQRYANTRVHINDWTDMELLFRKSVAMALELIERHRPDCLIFANIPHRSATLALFGTARALGIETALCIQSPFPGRLWIVDDWRDLGVFASSRQGEAFRIDIAPPGEMPFYMRKIRPAWQKTLRAALKYAEFNLRFALTPFDLALRRDATGLNRVLDELRNAGQMLKYNRMRSGVRTIAFDSISGDFVYFPLHLQPEMTTDILGGKYGNHIVALEAIRAIVPGHIPVIVKENPKQTGLMRGALFWERLAAIPNVLLTADNAPSLELVRRAAATAVITGTAGWEALRCGKPVIVLANTFWRSLPGAFHVSTAPSWDEIAAFRFDAQAFAEAVEAMSRRSYHGVADLNYSRIVDGFSPGENRTVLAASLAAHFAESKRRQA